MISDSLMWWMQWLAKDGLIEWGTMGNPVAHNCIKRITWNTINKLEEAGLVCWSEPYLTPKFKINKVKLQLTQAGKDLVTQE